jgi:hypothetical protein
MLEIDGTAPLLEVNGIAPMRWLTGHATIMVRPVFRSRQAPRNVPPLPVGRQTDTRVLRGPRGHQLRARSRHNAVAVLLLPLLISSDIVLYLVALPHTA